ncbi:MAG: DUF6134 family protein [Xanthomonadales bacterium]
MFNKSAIRTLLAVIVLGAAVQPLAADESDRWLFRVYLDDREIGYHEFTVTERDGRRDVETTARFDVKFLFINAYSYDHQNRETWSGDCLQGLDAVTDDNGTEYRVNGEAKPNGFLLNVNRAAERIGSDCVRTFAYWNPAILQADRLLNSQTGELADVTIRSEGPDTLEIGPHRVAAEQYTIETEDGPIRLWYAPGGQHWLALEAETDGGRTLRYVPLILPWNAVGETRLAMD